MFVEGYISVIYLILLLAVAITYINHRYIRMQPTIAIMISSLFLSFIIIIIGNLGFVEFQQNITDGMRAIKFNELLMNGLLGLLLFAGALTVDINNLKEYKWEILTLSCLSTIASTFLIGVSLYYLLPLFHISLDFIYCLLFGALISPTDPIATLNICREVNAPKMVKTCVSGESLFNDGVGIVLFITILGVITGKSDATFGSVSALFLQEAIGGIIYGILIGLIGYKLIKPLDDHKLEILITIAIATGGYTIAQLLHISGPISMVVAGLFIGNKGNSFTVKESCIDHLFTFWEVIDELLNALLFILIGFEFVTVPNQSDLILPAILAIIAVLVIRFVSVGIPISIFKIRKNYVPHMIKIMVWGGIRGGLAVALALSLTFSWERNVLLVMTYAVVTFSILIQGTTVKNVISLSKSE
ncbi:MAG: sodium:proton antiporter [Chlamydiota bacterium]